MIFKIDRVSTCWDELRNPFPEGNCIFDSVKKIWTIEVETIEDLLKIHSDIILTKDCITIYDAHIEFFE